MPPLSDRRLPQRAGACDPTGPAPSGTAGVLSFFAGEFTIAA
jgi:hypothetical protein